VAIVVRISVLSREFLTPVKFEDGNLFSVDNLVFLDLSNLFVVVFLVKAKKSSNKNKKVKENIVEEQR
jgi:hypothetical protein